MRKIHLSYSSITSFKACPTRFFAKYICGLRSSEETDCQRRGTNWHELLEVAGLQEESVCVLCANQMHPDEECPVCAGTGYLKGDAMDAAIRVLDRAYNGTFPGKTDEEIQTEYAKLLYSLSGYRWFWGMDEGQSAYDVIATEVPFELSLVNPETGNPARDAVLIGKIDKIVKWCGGGVVAQVEHKSTSKPIGNDSFYWNHLQMDTQTTLYPYAMYRMQKEGKLEHLGIMPDDPLATTVFYDVYHAPQIKMKKLSKADTIKFIKTGEYCGETFEVSGVELVKEGRKTTVAFTGADPSTATVDGHPVTITENKDGTLSFTETQDMYGSRLLADITATPDKYFNRREIQRSEDDLIRFENQLHSMYQCILQMRRTGGWYPCEHECDSKFRCEYTKYCWHGEAIEPGNVLEGFQNMFDKKEEKDDQGNA